MVDKRRLGLKPDWGKPTVRNFREGSGNVTRGAGLRPTAKAVDTPPDPTVGAPALYPTRGKSQSPVTWMAGWRETETLKPIDQAIERMVSESPGRNGT